MKIELEFNDKNAPLKDSLEVIVCYKHIKTNKVFLCNGYKLKNEWWLYGENPAKYNKDYEVLKWAYYPIQLRNTEVNI